MKKYIEQTINELQDTAVGLKKRASENTDPRLIKHCEANAKECMEAIHLLKICCRSRSELRIRGYVK